MAPAGDMNLEIALTILQFVALALPAIYIFLQLIDEMENTFPIEDANKYHIVRISVLFVLIASIILLGSKASNLQDSLVPPFISAELEGFGLLIAILFTGGGIVLFGLASIVHEGYVPPSRIRLWAACKVTLNRSFRN